MFEEYFKNHSELTNFAASEGYDVEQAPPMAVEGEGLYSRYRFLRNGLCVGYGVITP